jgi:hypothetical protein
VADSGLKSAGYPKDDNGPFSLEDHFKRRFNH